MVHERSRGPRVSRQGWVIQAFREWVEPFSEYYVEPLDFIEREIGWSSRNGSGASEAPAASRSRTRSLGL